ncbi:MAG: hypothetical protein A2Y10_12420 [Planctomycetes bacterium GWF2_41_51]|nr:MAG: hypothetical protein A2Y10_12420 [Planctomycetes bacterium GWF2_41_51]HBG27226.1 hypothetical protein [Phycisphaerales bacterium]
MSMKVLLVNVKNPYVDSNNPPLGLCYIASWLREKSDADIKIADMTVEKIDDEQFIQKYINAFQPEIIGISALTPTFNYAVELARLIKKHVNTPIVIGGAHVSSLPEETLEMGCFDTVVTGEGEISFAELCQKVKEGTALPKIVHGEPVNLLDHLPFPARDLVDLKRYGFEVNGEFGTSIITSRSCPFNCIFCNKSVFKSNFRQHSAEHIYSEIVHLMKDFGCRSFNFLDDTFTFRPAIAQQLCNKIIDNNLQITWKCMTRVDCIDKPMLELLKKAGCVEIVIGVETGDAEIMKKIRKGITLEQVQIVMGYAKELSLATKTFFMIGFPWDTDETICKTINFAIDLSPDNAQFALIAPFPGTKLCGILKEMGIEVSRKWGDYLLKGDEVNYAYSLPGLSKNKLKEYVRLAYKCFEKKQHISQLQ